MGIVQAYKMAIKSILGNKVRSLLTMLGVIIGVAAVIAAVAFAQGSTKSITDQIQGLGTNLIQISITGRDSNRNVTFDGLSEFADENSDIIASLAPQVNGNITAKFLSKSRDTRIVGTTEAYGIIKNQNASNGRYLTAFDTEYRQKIAIIGTAVVKDIFQGADPIGESVKINGQLFKVVGVLEEKNGGMDKTDDDQIIIPINVAQRLMKAAIIRSFAVQATTPENVDIVMEKLTEYLTRIYKDSRSFSIFNQAQMLSTLSTITGTMMVVLGGIATISLVVGGIGIMNIMLVSVTERTREIGIRKAIGAKKRNILVQFLIEAIMVTGIGGLMGVAIGLSIIKFLIGGLKIVPVVYSLPWISLSFGVSLIVGVVFGLFPAYKASNLNPIEALRFE